MLVALTASCFPGRSLLAADGVWRERGFEDFRDGTFGNAGQNLYVSRAGVLQRIFQFDLNRDGFLDLVICNSHGKFEQPPAYLYPDPLSAPEKRIELAADGAVAGAVADLNRDGFDDLVLAMADNGVRTDLNSYIYFGSAEGFSERRLLLLPTPGVLSTATGDFNGDGLPDIAFLLAGKLRVFSQNALGFEHQRFAEFEIDGVSLAADDLSGDGATDVVVRAANGDVSVYWGGPNGLATGGSVVCRCRADRSPNAPNKDDGFVAYMDWIQEAQPLAKVIRLGQTPHVFAPDGKGVRLLPVGRDRRLGQPIALECPAALSAAVGDINGDGLPDLAIACRQKHQGGERSWIHWGTKTGFDESHRTPLASSRACDVAVTDLDGDGCDEVILCQYFTDDSYSSHSLVYRGARDARFTAAVELATADARAVLLTRAAGQRAGQLVFVNRMLGEKLGNPDVSIFWGDAKGFDPGRRMGVAGWGAVESLSADFNDDGRPDLALANESEDSVGRDPGSYIFLSGPNGLAHEPTIRLPTTRASGLACGDVNRDGFLDLVSGGFENPDLLVFSGTSDGWNTKVPQRIRLQHEGVVHKDPRWLYLADLNADDWLDLVVPIITADRSLILWGGPDGFDMRRSQWLPVAHGACARAADLLASGHLDLIFGGYRTDLRVPHNSFAYLFWNGPGGLRQDHCTQLPAAGACSMSVADFNNDGRPDLFLGSYHAALDRDTDSFVYWNRKGRGFSARDRQRLFTHSASGSLAADFNEDGWIDLAVANHKVEGDHRGWSAVWWNGPDGFDPRRVTRLPCIGPHGMTCIAPANQRDGGPEEFYESSVCELPAAARLTALDWEADVPCKTWLKAQLRAAESREALAQSAWAGPDGAGSWFIKPQAVPHGVAGRFVQYRLALGATNGVASPRVRGVSIHYTER
ncbi:MAG: VCBS repeat-containing protein [Planctomycetia bacterium]|nr:VCBS repeat-containing protein [Planctomycetia bacterium]